MILWFCDILRTSFFYFYNDVSNQVKQLSNETKRQIDH